MESDRVKKVVQRYFDGETTRSEEEWLANYLMTHDDIDAELKVVRDMLVGMSAIKSNNVAPAKPQKVRRRLRVWSASLATAVAASLIFAIVGSLAPWQAKEATASPEFVCHINGESVNSSVTAQEEANRILGDVANNMALAMASVDRLNVLCVKK